MSAPARLVPALFVSMTLLSANAGAQTPSPFLLPPPGSPPQTGPTPAPNLPVSEQGVPYTQVPVPQQGARYPQQVLGSGASPGRDEQGAGSPQPTQPAVPPAVVPGASGLPSTTGPKTAATDPLSGWYGYQTLGVDAAGLVAGIIGYQLQETGNARENHRINLGGALETGVLTIGGIGAPLVHVAHGNPGSAIASAQLRIFGAPLTAYAIGFIYCVPRELKNCWTDGLTLGNGITLGAVSLVDAFAFAHERGPSREDATQTRPRVTTPAAANDETATRSRWYGWQIATADGAALAASLAIGSQLNIRSKEGATYTRAFNIGMTYSLLSIPAGPIIHFAHGNPGRGVLSLALRFTLPGATALYSAIAYCSTSGTANGCLSQGAEAGVLVGAIAASAFDAVALGNETSNGFVRVGRPKTVPMQATPTFSVLRGGGLVALQGTF